MVKVERMPPSPAEYCEMRKACGLVPRTLAAAELGMPRSLFGVCLRDENGKLIGMGRVVGDLGCHVQVVDICVHPDFQKQGLSKKIMEEIMAFIKREVPDCTFVNLFADVDYLYQKFGFEAPTAKGLYLNRDLVSK